MQLSLENEIK